MAIKDSEINLDQMGALSLQAESPTLTDSSMKMNLELKLGFSKRNKNEFVMEIKL